MTQLDKLLIPLIAVTACLVVGASSNAATVEHSYPATGCQAFQSSADGWRDLNGAIYNQSTGTTGDYICPVVHNYAGILLTRVHVRVQDKHSSQNVYCHVYSRTASGGSASWSGRASSGFSSTYQTLELNSTAYSDGTSVVRCTVPVKHATNGASGVLGYTAL